MNLYKYYMITKSIFNYLAIKDVRLKEFDVLKYGFRESMLLLGRLFSDPPKQGYTFGG